jgi:carbon-monoxide dehydrogenase medium subunit
VLKHFQLHRPCALEEATALRVEHGEEAALYAGGTELLLAMKMGLAHWPQLIDVKRIPDLQGIRVEDGVLVIGAAATHHSIQRDSSVRSGWPALAKLEAGVANVRVRAAGTLAGNIAFAEPHADPPALLVALDATVELVGPGGRRQLPVERFLVGPYETALTADELVVAIRVPPSAEEARVAYRNFRVLERPSICVAVLTTVIEGRFEGAPTIVLGAVEETPKRLEVSEFAGAPVLEAAREIGAAASAAVEPVDDLAGSAEYKAHVTGVLVRRALEEVA